MLQRLFNKQSYEPFDPQEKAPQPTTKVANLVPLRAAPGTSIRYNPELIAHFEKHHAWLRDALESIRSQAENGDFAEAQRTVQSFRRTLTTHLLEENIKMYTYVAKCLAHDPVTKASMQSMKSEMDPVGTAAMRFANEYAKTGLTPFTKQQFLTELAEVGTALLDRMEWEESSLHTMYMPPEAYEQG